MKELVNTFTSTGSKFFHHQEAMMNLRNGKGQCVTGHIMCTDVCNHACAFCSVHHREGDVLPYNVIISYLTTLKKFDLRSVILSGGGNPILYKSPNTGENFNDLVAGIHDMGLEIGLITNGMPLREFQCEHTIRESWGTVRPETLDRISWIRISMAGLDHDENEVFVPDVDPAKTTLGFSYVAHDIYDEPEDPAHGKVSTKADLLPLWNERQHRTTRWFDDRVHVLTDQIRHYVDTYHPRYVRLLPNCLEPSLIKERCATLQRMADHIDPRVVFVQYKPPAPPRACYLGYIHPVLNTDGFVYPCDSCVLNEKAGHRFNEPWRVCHWSEVGRLYTEPVRSLVDPKKLCPGCVFTASNELRATVVDGTADLTPPAEMPEHVNFV